MAENLAELVCRCSNLKSDSVMYKGTQLSVRACGNCDNFQEENLEHVVMHCPNNDDIRTKMMLDLSTLESIYSITKPDEVFLNLLGKNINDVDDDTMMEYWLIAGTAINRMYTRTEGSKPQTGIG